MIEEETKKPKRRHIVRWCVLGFLLVLVIAIAGIAIWQRNNIKALYYAVSMDQEQIEAQLAEKEQSLLQQFGLSENPAISLTEEQLAAMADGSMSLNDVVEQVNESSAPQEPADNVETSDANADHPDVSNDMPESSDVPDTTQPEPEPSESSAEAEVDAALNAEISKLYILKASFTYQLEALMNAAIAEYEALPASERKANKQKIISDKISQASGLESSCDGQVSEIVTEVRRLLKESGRDTSLADQLMSAYEDEKSLKKAYYLSLLS